MDQRDFDMIMRIFVYSVIFATIAVTITAIYASFKPAQLDMERQAEVRSPQYVEARRTEILDDVAAIRQLDVDIAHGASDDAVRAMRLQRESLCDRVRRSVAQIPHDAVPPGTEACH